MTTKFERDSMLAMQSRDRDDSAGKRATIRLWGQGWKARM